MAAAIDGLGDSLALAHNVESSLGGQLLAPLGNQGDLLGPELHGQIDDCRIGRQLEVEPDLHRLPKQSQVTVLDMPAVFPEMDGDAVGATKLGQCGRPDRVWLLAASRLAESRDMIDIDTQASHVRNPPSQNCSDLAGSSLAQGRFCPPPWEGRGP